MALPSGSIFNTEDQQLLQPQPSQDAQNKSPSDGDPALRRRLSRDYSTHLSAARSLREVIKNLVHDTFGVNVVGLKRLSAFKDVNFLIDGILPPLEAVTEQQPQPLLGLADGNPNVEGELQNNIKTNTTPSESSATDAVAGGDTSEADGSHRPGSHRHHHHRQHHPPGPVQKFLLKMLNEEESNKDAMVHLVDGQTTLARHLHARGFPTHVPMPSKSGALFEILPVPFAELLLYHIDKSTDHESVMITLNNSLVRLFPYLPGVPLADVPELGEHELHDVGALLAMVHNSVVDDVFDHSAYRFWSEYLDEADLDDAFRQKHEALEKSEKSHAFKQHVKRRMSKDEANRIMPFWSFDKVAEAREAGEMYVMKQNRKNILKLAFDRCEKVLHNKELLKKLPKAAIHGDFNPWNLIVDQPNSTPRTSTSSDSISWGVAASATELASNAAKRTLSSRADSLTSPPPPLSAPLTLGRYKLNGIIDFGESHFSFLIFDIAISLSSTLDVMYTRHFHHPSTPDAAVLMNKKSMDFSQHAVQASMAAHAFDEDDVDDGKEEKHDPMMSEAARKVEKWFNCFIAGYESKRALSQDERDSVIPLVLGWEAMAIALSKKELAKQPENRYVQGFCGDQDWRRLNSFLQIFPKVEAKNNGKSSPPCGCSLSSSPPATSALPSKVTQQH